MSARRIAVVTSSLVALLATVGTAAQGAAVAPGLRCLEAPARLVRMLDSGLRPKARGRLGVPRAVRSRTRAPIGGHGFLAEIYFVSAEVRGFGLATWAVDASAFRTGYGFAAPLGRVARRASRLGADVPASVLLGWGLSDTTDGSSASRRCAR